VEIIPIQVFCFVSEINVLAIDQRDLPFLILKVWQHPELFRKSKNVIRCRDNRTESLERCVSVISLHVSTNTMIIQYKGRETSSGGLVRGS